MCRGRGLRSPPPAAPKRTLVRFTIGTPGGGLCARRYAGAGISTRASLTSMSRCAIGRRRSATSACRRGDADLRSPTPRPTSSTRRCGSAQRGDSPSTRFGVSRPCSSRPFISWSFTHRGAGIRDLTNLQVGIEPGMSSTQIEAQILLSAHGVDRSRLDSSRALRCGGRAPLAWRARRLLQGYELSR